MIVCIDQWAGHHTLLQSHWKQEWSGFSGVGPWTVYDPGPEKVLALFRCCFCYSGVTMEKVIQRQYSGFLCPWMQTKYSISGKWVVYCESSLCKLFCYLLFFLPTHVDSHQNFVYSFRIYFCTNFILFLRRMFTCRKNIFFSHNQTIEIATVIVLHSVTREEHTPTG